MTTVNLNFKNVPRRFWIIVALTIFFCSLILAIAVSYSFFKGWSKIERTKHTIEKKK